MLHVRAVSPVTSTGSVVGMLSADPGVFNLVVLPGVSKHPDGDFVQFEPYTVSNEPHLVFSRSHEVF